MLVIAAETFAKGSDKNLNEGLRVLARIIAPEVNLSSLQTTRNKFSSRNCFCNKLGRSKADALSAVTETPAGLLTTTNSPSS